MTDLSTNYSCPCQLHCSSEGTERTFPHPHRQPWRTNWNFTQLSNEDNAETNRLNPVVLHKLTNGLWKYLCAKWDNQLRVSCEMRPCCFYLQHRFRIYSPRSANSPLPLLIFAKTLLCWSTINQRSPPWFMRQLREAGLMLKRSKKCAVGTLQQRLVYKANPKPRR